MFSKFFINRPIFATVLSIVVLIAGFVSIKALAVEEYPEVTPPQVAVMAMYNGANAETISKTVATVLEQQINGVDDMIYMTSTSSSSGNLMITISFNIGTNPDQATINVNNRVQQALASLPQEVQQLGVTVVKRSATILKMYALYSENNTFDAKFMANYALINIIDDLKRVPGIGDASLFSRENYSMRIWLDTDAITKFGLTSADVVNAISEQNNQFAAGKINQSPIMNNKEAFTYTLKAEARLVTPEEFGEIILTSNNNDGSSLKLKDVAKIELGSESYEVNAKLNGQTMIPIPVYLQSGANAIATSKLADEAMEKISKNFPEGLQYKIPYDTTKFISLSINEVYKTFIEAMLLVMIIIYFFLQNLRATIIPLLAVPVSIIGTFAGMYVLGFSINLLTLFGLILAIGIVVDDAIIVIENTERILRSNPTISPKDAAIQAMQEVTGPVVAIVLVLCAVFIPVTFMGGFTGQMYQQFAVTIVISVVISGMVALTLTPALCAIFLTRKHSEPFWLVKKFNDFFDFSTKIFSEGVKLILKRSLVAILVMVVIFATAIKLFMSVPSGLVPSEDKGVLLTAIMLPPAATVERTNVVANELSAIIGNDNNFDNIAVVSGYDLLASTLRTSSGIAFLELSDWSKRKNANQSSFVIADNLNKKLNFMIPEATFYTLNPPPIMGLSISGGFEMYIQDRTGGSLEELGAMAAKVVEKAKQRPELIPNTVRSTYEGNVPQYEIKIDRENAKSKGVVLTDVYKVLQSTFGSYYINDFNLYGRTYKVNIQAQSHFRASIEDLKNLYVRSLTTNELIPISTLVKFEKTIGPDTLERFNVFNSVKVSGEPNIGYTSGDAIKAIEEVANEILPDGYTIGWVGSSYQEKEMAGSGAQAFMFGIIFIFLILAAQYERWLMPLAVITAVPFAAFGAILAVYLRRLAGNDAVSNDLYFQVGLLVLIGLSAKNAILIVEFAMMMHEKGMDVIQASVEAAKLRFRPIVMTSLAFTLGVIPLAISSGAGAASRHSIGTGVIGGMIAATTISIFFVPLFYTWLAKLGAFFTKKKQKYDNNQTKEVITHE